MKWQTGLPPEGITVVVYAKYLHRYYYDFAIYDYQSERWINQQFLEVCNVQRWLQLDSPEFEWDTI